MGNNKDYYLKDAEISLVIKTKDERQYAIELDKYQIKMIDHALGLRLKRAYRAENGNLRISQSDLEDLKETYDLLRRAQDAIANKNQQDPKIMN